MKRTGKLKNDREKSGNFEMDDIKWQHEVGITQGKAEIRLISQFFSLQSGRASPQVSSRSVSPATFGSNGLDLSGEASAVTGTPQPSLQAKVLPQSVPSKHK